MFVATYQMILIFLLPVILMSSSYYRVITALWRSTKNMTVLTNTRPCSGLEQGVCSADLNTDVVTRPVTRLTSTGAGSVGQNYSSTRPFTVRTSFRPSPRHMSSDQASASFTQGLTDDARSTQRTFLQQQSNTTVNKTKKINQSRKQIIKMLLVIIFVFTACWCPRFMLNIIKWIAPMKEWEFNYNSHFLYYFSRIAKILPVIHAMLNPIIYRLTHNI